MKQLMKIMAIALLSVGSLEAKGPSSSGSRSMSSSSSRSSSSFSRPSAPASKPSSYSAPKPSYVAPSKPAAAPAKPSSYTPSKPNTSVAQTSTRPTSNVESARYKEAVKSGKTFQTREAAVNDFKATKASSYTSRYATEPSTRPQYIPPSYRSNDGHTYNITYNQGGGGYGYYNPLGAFILYDIASDAIMMNAMMDRDHYYVGNAPTPVANTTYVQRESSTGFVLICGLVVLLVGGAIVFAISRSV